MKAAIRYEINGEQYGEVRIFVGYTLVAEKLTRSVMRMTPENVELMTSWVGFDQWTWLGIVGNNLPRGVAMTDVLQMYQIARDELAERGFTVAA